MFTPADLTQSAGAGVSRTMQGAGSDGAADTGDEFTISDLPLLERSRSFPDRLRVMCGFIHAQLV